ncbi:MAG: membrane fusion protein (multidrug efflux system) [Flavobacteriales bacterium]|jgi:membrane fusion protein (multidrug efflux system)
MTHRFRLVALGAALVFFGCQSPSDEGADSAEGSGSETAHEHALVETIVLNTGPFRDTIPLNGETLPIRSATVSSEMAGRISRFPLVEGERVAEGDDALRVSTTTYGPQRDQLQTSLAQLQRDVTRQEELIQAGLGTNADLQRVQTEARLTEQRIAAINTVVGTARTRVPIDGIVVDTFVEVGEYVGPGTPVARIIEISTLLVIVGLPESELSFVREGMEIAVYIPALDHRTTGRLTEIALEAESASRAFPLEIEIDNNAGLLRAGMRARVEIPRRDIAEALLIPRDAIVQGLESEEVFVVEDHRAVVREIDVIGGTGTYAVVASGLSPGMSLIVRGHQLLVDGEQVREIEQGPCCAGQFAEYLGADAP